ncbi:hypothetical protein K7X08_007562 [Anisodus acutangulus]|uniref:Carbonic anhydrase n=1 Tax=Anisodus acutangulus TaxID=402998 RepID=A0A9Q1LG40_9SOLA|nr:hypothetical protein K7X08_007562 [Anisodus acutangulus]
MIINRGHDIKLQWEGDAGCINIDGTEFKLQQCHWHTPSEHKVDGKCFAMEAHMVHQSADGRMAVVAIPFKIGTPNPFLDGLIRQVETIDDKGLKLGMVNPQQLGVNDEPFYRYIGSLTVPPCTEGIVWTVLYQARTVSVEQMMALRYVVHDGFEANARPVQGLHKRPVYLAMYLPVSFNQAVGATTPFFTALFAYLITQKREAWVTYGCLVPVVAGVVIASGGEPSFHLYGFIMCIGATAARAFKSVLQGILLSNEGEKLNSMNLLLYMSPIAVLVLLPATLVMEPNVIDATITLAVTHRYLVLLILINSTMAYGANLLNFLVTKHTSALTLQVLGNAKGAVAVVISILLFRNPVTFIGIAGYAMTVMGVVAYGESKRRSK